MRRGARFTLALGLMAPVGCHRDPGPPPVDALQEAFRDGALTARESAGRKLFVERCATCHGPDGRGDGQNAYNLQPPPPDFASSLRELGVADRRRVIVEGTAALGRSPLCPPRGAALADDDVDALLAWLDVTAQEREDEPRSPGRRRWRRPGERAPGE